MTEPWHVRVENALNKPPTVLWHATTPRKLKRYQQTGAILPPVRGFDTEEAAREWARLAKRTVILRLDLREHRPQALPDHHQPTGLAWWTAKRVLTWRECP